MMHRLTATFICLIFAFPIYGIEIIEDIFAGAPHFIIKTKKATYYLDKEGGGLSRMLDIYGNDWISFKREPWELYPESAASSYRGIPNLVFKSEDSGVGHPGYKKCYSFVINENTILTISKSGKWQWRWKFYEDYASIAIEKVDHEQKYWFLYEGVIAGEFKPEHQYWGTNLGGPRKEFNDFYKGDKIFANWHWVYYGDDRVKQILFVAMKKPDRQIDAMGFLGNSSRGVESDDGMVVFGFGRQGNAEPQLTDIHNTFYIGFLKGKVKNQSGHESVAKEIANIIRKDQ
jgi:hypothetical protein